MSIFQREACHIFSTWTGHADTVKTMNTLHFDGGLPLSELLDGPLLAREATVSFFCIYLFSFFDNKELNQANTRYFESSEGHRGSTLNWVKPWNKHTVIKLARWCLIDFSLLFQGAFASNFPIFCFKVSILSAFCFTFFVFLRKISVDKLRFIFWQKLV